MRILLVNQVGLYREGLRQLLAQHDGIIEVNAVSSLEQAIASVAQLQPTVVLLDTANVRRDAILALKAAWTRAKVVVFGVEENDRDVVMCAEAGVAGYVSGNGTVEDLITAVESLGRGEVQCSPRVAATLFRRLEALAEWPARPVGFDFTIRERQIADLLARGLSNKEIARRLGIEVPTVKNHVHRVLEKLRVKRRAQAAARLLGSLTREDLDSPGRRSGHPSEIRELR